MGAAPVSRDPDWRDLLEPLGEGKGEVDDGLRHSILLLVEGSQVGQHIS